MPGMVVDQEQIDSMMAEAAQPTGDEAGAAKPAVVSPHCPPTIDSAKRDPDLQRIRKLRVPVIVQLAGRPMSIGIIRSLSNGAILEFDKSVDDDLLLLINNRRVGRGSAAKVGEKFGLRIRQIDDQVTRIKLMGH